MTDTKRTLVAGLLIGVLTLFIPFYLNLIGILPGQEEEPLPSDSMPFVDRETSGYLQTEKAPDAPALALIPSSPSSSAHQDLEFVLVTEKYQAIVSSRGGGSIKSFKLLSSQKDGYKYLGGYDDFGEYDALSNVELVLPFVDNCSPCLSINNAHLITEAFNVVSPSLFDGQIINLYGSDSLVVVTALVENNQTIRKVTTFFADKYIINHDFSLESPSSLGVSVLWNDGIRATEKNLAEELTYSEGYAAQAKDIQSISLSPSSLNDLAERKTFLNKTDWVAIRNKYFINSLIASDAVGGELSAKSFEISGGSYVPAYSMGLLFNSPTIHIKQFFGPLDVDVIASSKTYLDRVMNFGWLPLQPFSRSVLWILKKLHLVGLNYGLILIFFAFLIRFITGPLTKKSYKSTQKMQTIQPELKKIQEKYKNDSARLNREMMGLYKKHGVNPLGGCIPMLIQMPLLFALFIVFRSTIEFRGAPFFGWISNLSQPDTIINLPFYIPIYGDQVAFLPIVLGISMFFSQKLSMATMDKSQKPMMYMMSVFFFLLFNSFPSGLNLYYTVYNILNYYQQKSIKGK